MLTRKPFQNDTLTVQPVSHLYTFYRVINKTKIATVKYHCSHYDIILRHYLSNVIEVYGHVKVDLS